MVIQRCRGASGVTTSGRIVSASGGPDWGSTQVAYTGWSYTTQWSQSDVTVTVEATERSS